MTKGELQKLSDRVDEIDQTMDLCDSNRDADILDNLEAELDEIMKQLEEAPQKGKLESRDFALLSEPLDYQVSFRLQELERHFSKDLIRGIVLSRDYAPVPKPTHLETWDASEIIRLHLTNLIASYPIKNIVDVFEIHGYDVKKLKQGLKQKRKAG
jgi:hypothetical protein